MEANEGRACPVDQGALEQEILVAFGDEVVVDRCGRCRGVFLDADELLDLTADHALNRSLRDRHATDHASVRMCPECNVRMDMEDARDVEVEVCPKCDGLWLDGGELEKLLARPPQPA